MKTKRSENYKKILTYIRENPNCTLLQISKDTNINWETVKYATDTMFEIEVINYKILNNNKKTFFSNTIKSLHPFADEELQRIRLDRLLGSGNKCPVCKQEGYFGSITTAIEEDKSEWLVCGHCMNISKKKDDEKYESSRIN